MAESGLLFLCAIFLNFVMEGAHNNHAVNLLVCLCIGMPSMSFNNLEKPLSIFSQDLLRFR